MKVLSEIEFKQMINLIGRFSRTEMDQFELWKFKNKISDTYVTVSIGKPEGEDAYTDLTKLLDQCL